MLLQPITVQFSKSTLKPSVYTLMFVYKRRFSHHPLRVLVLWDFPTSVTLKSLPSRQT